MAATNHSQSIKQDSKDYLTTALLDLLKTENFTDITVTKLVKRAGVSRMAFYRNFETTDDLLRAYFQPLVAQKFADIENIADENDKLMNLGNFFSELAPTFLLAQKHGFEYIIQNVFNENMEQFYEKTIHKDQLSTVQRTYWIKFMSTGVYTIWREWLFNGQKESLQQIHQILADLQTGTLNSLLKK